ncbi:MbtH family NRPS accessory protein [Kitasatospora gansuensis]
MNSRGQYSIWPSHRELPPGWQQVGRPALLADCAAVVDTLWTDIRPHSTGPRRFPYRSWCGPGPG